MNRLKLHFVMPILMFALTLPTASADICSGESLVALQEDAKNNDVYAAATLGMMNELGICDKPSFDQVKVWYTIAAQQGDSYIQMRLGNLYYYVAPDKGGDKELAFYWFQKAAESGLPGGMVMLANHYMLGEGVEKDLVQAYYWFAKANGGVLPEGFGALLQQMSGKEIAAAKALLKPED